MREYKDRVMLTMSECSVSELGHASFSDPVDVLGVWANVEQMSNTKTMLTFQQANVVGLEVTFRNPHREFNGLRWRGHQVSLSYVNMYESRDRIVRVQGYYQIDNPVY